MSNISKIKVGGTTYDIKDASVQANHYLKTETYNQAEINDLLANAGGTGVTILEGNVDIKTLDAGVYLTTGQDIKKDTSIILQGVTFGSMYILVTETVSNVKKVFIFSAGQSVTSSSGSLHCYIIGASRDTNFSVDLDDVATNTSIKNQYLAKTNTTSYTPTKDYHPATKQYVDNNTHVHDNKAVIDNITSSDITAWNNKSDFDGSYNSLTNKPTIPTNVSDLKDDVYYVTTSGSKAGTGISITQSILAKKSGLIISLNEDYLTEQGYAKTSDIANSKSWTLLTNGEVSATTLNENFTIDLIDDWTNYNEILILAGTSLLECNNVIIYPNTAKKAEIYHLSALSNYQMYAYTGVGINVYDSSDTKKCFFQPREISGYDLTTMKILAVYGR